MKNVIITMVAMLIMASCTDAQNKKLVVYFSATGTTENSARKIAEAAKADLFEIEPLERYSDADLDWRDSNSRSTVEMQDKDSRPGIKDKTLKIDRYGKIYLGFPVWWDLAPRVVNSFIEKYSLKGKTVVVFATSGGSSTRNSVKVLKETYPDVSWIDGGLMNSPTKSDITQLLKK